MTPSNHRDLGRACAVGLIMVVFSATGPNAGAQCTIAHSDKVFALDGATGDQFGEAVAASRDLVVVGAPFDDNAEGVNAGSVYVFRRSGNSYLQDARLVGSDLEPGDIFGVSVSVSGERIIVGAALGDTTGGVNAGAAYVFRWNGAAWVQEAKLSASDGTGGDYFGYSVSISGDWAIVGAPLDDTVVGGDAGSAYIYRWNGSVWSEVSRLSEAIGPGDRFGWSVAVSGNRAVIGAYLLDLATSTSDEGWAFGYFWNGSQWEYGSDYFDPQASPNNWFGYSVSILDDHVIIGAPGDDSSFMTDNGSAWLYGFGQQDWRLGGDFPGERFGSSVSVWGVRALIGSPNISGARLFRWSGTNWDDETFLYDPGGMGSDQLGYSVSIADGVAVAGAHFADAPSIQDGGTAWVFSYAGPVALRQPITHAETAGLQAALSFIANGMEANEYRWRRSRATLVDGPSPGGGMIIGAATNALIIENVGEADAGDYDCLVTDSCGITVSAAATLSIVAAPPPPCPGDADHNGAVTFADITAVLTAFNSMCP